MVPGLCYTHMSHTLIHLRVFLTFALSSFGGRFVQSILWALLGLRQMSERCVCSLVLSSTVQSCFSKLIPGKMSVDY